MHCMITQPLNIVTDRMFSLIVFQIAFQIAFIHSFIHFYSFIRPLTCSVHARKLYLASLFRCFDEADYSPAQDLPYEPTRVHTPRDPIGEIPADQIHGDGRVCYYKNTLRNGLVIAALENRYDHMVRSNFVTVLIYVYSPLFIYLSVYFSWHRSSLKM